MAGDRRLQALRQPHRPGQHGIAGGVAGHAVGQPAAVAHRGGGGGQLRVKAAEPFKGLEHARMMGRIDHQPPAARLGT